MDYWWLKHRMLYKENGDETIVRKKREATKFN